ncbi:nicotinate-nucleotide adenylyltransferase (Deamido-NAD(+) pyrophosphorylase) [Loigolactobacillus coryniformis subsp. coryniformis KCTC 3167 = DSM 20001]|uniref:Probable nicotinate-nucleotide adenylyltransferase n=2 Tax=Loigolactobacillus coryniformis TaxID=1610 RepID=A0A0R1FGB8_9LACO|nr:nicotinate-nucleotide adenylyltransferase (Deamido-NAD(+) pyrophosphorylase) [Loigolactobacillus coryniformis subsp. coryniformis KCTC 3167 = DSM 20001]
MRTLTQPVITVEMKEEILGSQHKKQVGIMGGTFNPPHLGHLVMAESVGSQLGLEKVLFMPDAQPPHQATKTTIAAKHRLAMVERAIDGNSRFELERAEIDRGGVSYTYDTMVTLKQQHPDTDFYFIIGADMVKDLPNWHRIDDLLKLVQFVGVKRPEFPAESRYPVLWVDAPLLDISSSLIRQRISQNCSVRYLVPDAVLDYIEEEGLYREKH